MSSTARTTLLGSALLVLVTGLAIVGVDRAAPVDIAVGASATAGDGAADGVEPAASPAPAGPDAQVPPAAPPALPAPAAPVESPAPAPVDPASVPAPVEQAPAPAPPAPEPTLSEPTAAAVAVDPLDRVRAAYAGAVPAAWRAALDVELRIIEGDASWATAPDLIEVGRDHVESSDDHLASVIAHEFGHLVAFGWGTNAFPGAAPDGWPDPRHGPSAEAWADCVAQAFTQLADPSYGMPPCPSASLDWTAAWLSTGPQGPPRSWG